MTPPIKGAEAQLGMFDVKVDNKELLDALNRWVYLGSAVNERDALEDAIDALFASEFPDVAAGVKRLKVGNELIIEYEVKEPKRKWKVTETPFTAATSQDQRP